MASINDVAKKAGVSPATVSRTFSTPALINEQTQKRVLEVARQMNYQPRRMRNNAGNEETPAPVSDAIGFQFFAAEQSDTLQTNTFYASLLAGAQAEASALGLHLLLHTTTRHGLQSEMPRMIVEKAVTGMLLVGTADPLILNAFAQHVPKIVLVDNRDATGKYESVVSDGFGGAFAATRFLLELGHRRIAFFLSEPEVSTFRDRLHGYQCALMEAGIPLDPSLLVAEPTLVESEKRLAALICSGEKPTALLAANDFHAFHALRTCRSLGQCVPQDISLMGFDDSTFSTHTDPALTTSRVETEYMGRLAVRRLVAQMNAEGNITSAAPPVCNVVPVSLVVRQSCRALLHLSS